MPRRRSSTATWPLLHRFSRYLQPHLRLLSLILFLLFCVTGLDLLRPYLIGLIIDLAAAQKAWLEVLLPLFLLLVTILGRGLFLLARNRLMQLVGMRVTCDLRIALFAHLQKLSMRFYDERHTGRIIARISHDTSVIYNLITGASVNLIGDLLTMSGVLVVLLVQNWKLALVTYLILPLFVANYLWHRRRLRVESRLHRRNWDSVMSFLHERITSTRVVKSFATEHLETESFQRYIESDYDNYTRVITRHNQLNVGADTLSGIGSLLVIGTGAFFVVYGIDGFSVGQLAAFNFYLALLYAPIIRVVEANAMFQQATSSLEKIFHLLDTQPHIPENEQLPQMASVRGQIKFEHVAFAYRPQHSTLKEISFTVEPGEMMALVGPSGAGKSTIITLLARFYDPTSGRILLDGQDIREFNVQSVRRHIGIVLQDNILFSGSIAENIKYGRREATKEEVIHAAEMANAHEFIRTLPKGYQTQLGERGVKLSGGQRQRIAIARVLLKNPRILILDEATSALDTQSERLIQEALDRLMRERTSIVIAHRLSTVINASRILVMKDGAIVEQGQHHELLLQHGLYRELHDLQFASPRKEGLST
jgi:ATP-binding cassette, subfamily B, bacterial MsbA